MEELIEICLSEGKVIQALNLGKVIQALNLGKEKHYLLLSITHWISPLFNHPKLLQCCGAEIIWRSRGPNYSSVVVENLNKITIIKNVLPFLCSNSILHADPDPQP